MSAITTHVLDMATGRPATGMEVVLEFRETDERWTPVGEGTTDADGRLRSLLPAQAPLAAGTYRLVFQTAAYFTRRGTETLYPLVVVVFQTTSGEDHYHVPLLLSPFGYSTYRGT
jgi:5-hydroxyisourate hydrolase